ncbi:nitrate reductase [Novosphingobium taihuense]|uniref:Assimilatory nitrate reductase catalytic subunit n=1 Tax=Novosphingobium taihuense TaxID=260085 RepID=A0A7W7AAG0_9SPHN|nr:molybdopterin-dependent oxidoreductase [Novosphingobium taihuense]MBB4613404.1 assimilatory nitrate reductase catalytic subunit [Novosphingobium taihuense]TWH80910.1 assimilatory nitrate reductase (NADH) alpha subunit apoprotein [Novosphingobium taihuense]
MREVRTTCAYCGVGCGIRAEVTGERSVTIRGDAEHPANFGKLCSKGTHLGETVGLDGRLLHPMIGERRAGWDEAIGLVAGKMRDCIEQHGPDSVALYVSGQLLTEDYYAANKLMKGFVGSANIDTNSRLCMASAVAAHNRAFGEDVVPVTYQDLDEADLILLVGSNTAWCHPVIWQRIEAAREARGTKIVVIDPRRTETAEQADLHVPVKPDGDVGLFNALLSDMVRRGLADPIPAMGEHGLSPDVFAALADLVAAHPRMVTVFSMGANQSVAGSDKGNAIINLHLAMGRINAPGMGPFSMTGQPNAMGGREVGGLANMLACHLGFSEAEISDVSDFWQAPRMCSGPGLKAVDLFRAVHDGRVKFLWVMATNPAVSMPDAGFVREALARCETVVVSDVIADTDTAKFAQVRLPALAWGEKDGTVTNSERRISRQRALFDAPGEARSDWAIIGEVAKALGFAGFDWTSAADVFREYAAMTAVSVKHGKVLDLTDRAGLSDADYDAMEPFLWGGRHPMAGRAMALVPVEPRTRAVDPAFPLRLNTGRYRDQWHTMTRTGLSPTLAQHRREPLLEVHPDDAASARIIDGTLARVVTASGASAFRVLVTEAQGRGQVFVPMHWSDAMASGGRGNLLPDQSVDPVSGQPGFKNNACRIEPVASDWRAFLLRKDVIVPDGLVWWSRSAVAGGWLYELAGDGAVDADVLLPAGERIEAVDMARGMRRLAVIDGAGALSAALFVTRTGQLPSRDWIAGQLGTSGAALPELLAARPSTPAPDRGPVVCVCHGIGANQILAAAEAGAGSVAEVGRACGAGTNCGSCRPAIARLLREWNADMTEAAQ